MDNYTAHLVRTSFGEDLLVFLSAEKMSSIRARSQRALQLGDVYGVIM